MPARHDPLPTFSQGAAMPDYEIGYGKTPTNTRFQPGRSGNPKGRPRRTADPLGQVVQSVLDATVKYRENGRTKTASRTELRLKMMLERAVKGDIKASEALLDERKHALKDGGANTIQLVVTDFLPDFDGQTAEEKTAALVAPTSIPGRRPPMAAEPVGGGEREQVTDK